MAFAFASVLLACFGELAVILCSGIFARPVVGQFRVPYGSVVYCCN